MGRPRVVLAHGRAAQFDIPDSTSRLWADALRLSLLRVGSNFAQGIDVGYAYFGGFWRPDVAHDSPRFRDSKGRRYSVKLDPTPSIVVEPAPPGGVGPAIVGDLAGLADQLPDFLLKPLLKAAIPDVFEYLDQPTLQTKVDKVVRDACTTADTAVLVGFSMGSIVGYNMLRTAKPALPVKTFITCGSPIALGPIYKEVRRVAGGATPFPPNLSLWLNLWSDSDAATGIHGDAMTAMFPSAAPGRAIQHTQNWGRTAEATNPFVAHDPVDYLSSLAMGVALHTALVEATKP
jgi:pimeloyl-ACP methyl ester carboxylesterase